MFDALAGELGVREDLIRALVLMYQDVTQQVTVDGTLSATFRVDQGVW